jgi:putative chitinase
MNSLTQDSLAKFCPRPKAPGDAQTNWDGYVGAMTSPQGYALFKQFGIDTKEELCAFLANAAEETGDRGGFTCLWENLNFTSVAAIRGAWASRASKYSDAWIKANLIRNPPAIGAWAYDGRMGNGVGNGDGYKYRGFGILQTTGKTSHIQYLRGDYSYLSALRAALMEWKDKNCDAHIAAGDFRTACVLINGGTNGLSERIAYFSKAKKIWTKDPDWAGSDDAAPVIASAENEDGSLSIIDPVVPPLVTPPTAAELGQVSAKASILLRVRNWLGWGGTGGAAMSVDSLLQPDGPTNNFLTIIEQHPLSVLAVGSSVLIGGSIIAVILIEYMKKDIVSGRYQPSGWTQSQ